MGIGHEVVIAIGGHAVLAAQVAAVSYRYSQILKWTLKPVAHRPSLFHPTLYETQLGDTVIAWIDFDLPLFPDRMAF